MGIDIALAIALIIALIKGYKEGLIMSVFSVSSYLIGFFAAIHFSFVLANYLTTNFNLPAQWIPIIAFILLFIAVILIVRFLGKFIEKLVGKILPSMLNRIAGSGLWMLIVFILVSLLYRVLDTGNLFTDELINSSVTASYLKSCGNYIQSNIGQVVPFVSNLYESIDAYFKEIAQKI